MKSKLSIFFVTVSVRVTMSFSFAKIEIIPIKERSGHVYVFYNKHLLVLGGYKATNMYEFHYFALDILWVFGTKSCSWKEIKLKGMFLYFF